MASGSLTVLITPQNSYVVSADKSVVSQVQPASRFVESARTSVSASYATTSDSAISASYAEVSATSSYADNLNVAGAVTASSFVGDGSQLTGVTAVGTGVTINDDGVIQGVAQILDFTDGIDATFASSTASISFNRTGSLEADFIQLDTTYVAGPHTTGRLYWDQTNNTATIDMTGTDVKLQVGQEQHLYVRNISGETIANGDVVRITGASGNNITVARAISDSGGILNENAGEIVGVATEEITNNSNGYVTTYGTVNDIDTSGFVEGQQVYLSNTISGSVVGTAPPAPYEEILVGVVERSHASVGKLFVRPRRSTHFSEIVGVTGSNIPVGISYIEHDSTTNIMRFVSGLTGSFTGSFIGDGSGLTDIVSASFATTASYVEGAASDWNTLTNKPAGLVSSSVQINTGSFSGSFTGDGSELTGVVSASHALNADDAVSASYAVTASYADNAGASDWSELTNVPSGLVSSSTQTIANINGQEITPSNISSSGHIVPSTTEIYDLGSTDLRWRDLYLSGSTIYLGNAQLSSIGQLLSGSFTGSFSGEASSITGVVSSSHAITASYADNAGASDWSELTNIPSGLVSSSGQVDHDQTTNYDVNEHFTQANITTVGTVTAGDVSAILPTGTVSSSGQVDYAGLSNIPSGIVSSSAQVDYDSIQNVPSGIVSASSFTSPSQGTVRATINGVNTDVDTGLQTGDSPQFTNLTLSGDLTVNGTTTYISSSQVDIGDQIITLNANNAAGDGGIYVNDTSTNETGSLLWDVSENYWIGGLLGSESELITLTSLNAKGVVSSSGQVDYTGLSNIPSGIVSSSTQVDYDSIQNVPSGIVSSSGQVDHDQTTNYDVNEHFTQANITTVGTVTTGDVSAILPTGTVSSSGQVDYTGLSNVPAGIVSSSQQINTGSFSGSFIGDGTGLTGLVSASHALNADDAVSSSYAITSSYSETSEWSGLNSIPSGLVSSSGQVDYTSISNVPSGIVSASSFTSPSQGTVRAIINGVQTDVDTGLQSTDSPQFVNVTLTGDLSASGHISSSTLSVDSTSSFNQVEYYWPADNGLNQQVLTTDGDGNLTWTAKVSGSVDSASYASNADLLDNQDSNYYRNADNINAGTLDNARLPAQINVTGYSGSFTGSFIGDGSSLTGIDTDQVTEATNLYYTDARVKTKLDADGVFSSSAQVDYDSIQNVPSGIVSSSTQFNTLTDPFSGSFTGSFIGDGAGLTGLVSSSYALTASYAANGGGGGVTINNNTDNYLVTATGTADTLDGEQFLTWDGNSLIVSGSDDTIRQLQIQDGSGGSGSLWLAGAGTTFYVEANNADLRLRRAGGGNNDLVWNGSQFFPAPNLTYELGKSNTQWETLWVGSVSASADVSASSFIGDGSQVTGVISSSYAQTASLLLGSVESSSYATTAETASLLLGSIESASFATTAQTASYISGYASFSDGLLVTGSITASSQVSASGGFIGDGSQVTGVVSSSYALTASYASNGGGGGAVSSFLNEGNDNYVITSTGTNGEINAESNLQFDGSKLTVTGDISASGDVSGSLLHIRGRNSDEFLGLFVSGNVTPEAPAAGGPGNTLSVQGSNQALFHGRDVTNDIDFLFGTSVLGVVFVGSMTNHNLELRRDNVPKLTIKNTEISSSNVPVTASGFWGDGSQVTGVVTSSYSNTASYVETAQTASYFIGDISFPSGLEVTGSLLLDGSMSASGDVTASAFIGDGSQVTGIVSALTASYVNPLTQNVEITGSLDVAGDFTAQTKSFLIDHQSLPGKKLIYGVLEGPEHAVYLRGRLTNDDTITFPEEWSWLVDKDSITVQLTPIGSHQHLWVEQVTETSITVNSNTDIDCYYLVHATRKDVDPLQTVE